MDLGCDKTASDEGHEDVFWQTSAGVGCAIIRN